LITIGAQLNKPYLTFKSGRGGGLGRHSHYLLIYEGEMRRCCLHPQSRIYGFRSTWITWKASVFNQASIVISILTEVCVAWDEFRIRVDRNRFWFDSISRSSVFHDSGKTVNDGRNPPTLLAWYFNLTILIPAYKWHDRHETVAKPLCEWLNISRGGVVI